MIEGFGNSCLFPILFYADYKISLSKFLSDVVDLISAAKNKKFLPASPGDFGLPIDDKEICYKEKIVNRNSFRRFPRRSPGRRRRGIVTGLRHYRCDIIARSTRLTRCTRSVRRMYAKCTRNVREMYVKCTRNVRACTRMHRACSPICSTLDARSKSTFCLWAACSYFDAAQKYENILVDKRHLWLTTQSPSFHFYKLLPIYLRRAIIPHLKVHFIFTSCSRICGHT